jgi:hypothetical protein
MHCETGIMIKNTHHAICIMLKILFVNRCRSSVYETWLHYDGLVKREMSPVPSYPSRDWAPFVAGHINENYDNLGKSSDLLFPKVKRGLQICNRSHVAHHTVNVELSLRRLRLNMDDDGPMT